MFLSFHTNGQETLLVPQEYSTIQSALNASSDGDVVLVSPGVYYENIVWTEQMHGVELKSTDGPENTAIDANSEGRGIYFEGETSFEPEDVQIIDETAVLDGFTIRNGFIDDVDWGEGAGMLIEGASPTLKNLIIEYNRLNSERAYGGGINFYQSRSIVENCIIRNNSVTTGEGWANGGGVLMDECEIQFFNCFFRNNIVESEYWAYGGGIYSRDSSYDMFNCTINGNIASGEGWSYGAGIYASNYFGTDGSDINLTGCKIFSNQAPGSRPYGVAIHTTGEDMSVNVINSLIYDNDESTSVIEINSSNVNIINSTIINNNSGIRSSSSNLDIVNSILWNNEYAIIEYDFSTNSIVNVGHCIVEGGWNGPGNLDSDPLLFDDILLVPTENSPCLNAGTRDIAIDTDILGNERPFPRGSAPDIGAYEINQSFAHVLSRFYFDENENGTLDTGEDFIGRGAISIEDESFENTSTNGIFTLVQDGQTTINYQNDNTGNWILTSENNEYTFDVSDVDFADSIFFGVYPSRIDKSIVTGIYSPALRCSRTITMDFFVKNEGTTRENGVLWAELDPLATEAMPLMTPDYIEDGRFGWDFINLLPGSSFTRKVSFKVPGVGDIEQGDLIKFVSEATVVSDPDCIATYCYEDDVRCSYDPNDKLVNPNRDDQYVLLDQPITYTIRFQNVGNDYADDVVVRDTLDPDLDYSTFKLLNSSHPELLRYTLSDVGVLNFDFHQIYLPDSTTDEQGSNGYVMYSILPDSTLDNFVKVENTAHIYFDFNPAIVTNTTQNSVVDEYPISSIKEEDEFILSVFPNPSTGLFYLPFEFDRVQILDNQGKLIKSLENTRVFDLSDAADGVYFVNATKDTDSYSGKVSLIRN